MQGSDGFEQDELKRELAALLRQVEGWLETPMIVLAFVWLALLIVELVWGLSPFLEVAGTAIWMVFVLDFLLRLTLAPQKLAYIKGNWLTAASLALPALRMFRIVRVIRLLWLIRATRGLRLVRIVSSVNRSMGALTSTLGRRNFGYVVTLTFVVLLIGAAGMYGFERDPSGEHGFESYGDALWWTAMILTTLGSQFWPNTAEGRVLCVLLSAYSLAILGYLTASLASFFIGRDAEDEKAELSSAQSIEALRHELQALRAEVRDRARTR